MGGYVGGSSSKGFQSLAQLGIEVVVDTTALETLKEKLKLSTVGLKGEENFSFMAKGASQILGTMGKLGGVVGILGGALMGVGGIFKQVVVDPMLRFFTKELVLAAQTGAQLVRSELVAVIPLTLNKQAQALSTAFASVAEEIRKAGMASIILPTEAAKTAFLYTRLANTTKGLGEYVQKVGTIQEMTGETTAAISGNILEWTKAFSLDIPTGAGKVANMMTGILATTGATRADMEKIATWIMPYFATATGDAEKNLAEMVSISAALAEKGTGMPIQMRSMAGALQQVLTPSAELLSIMTSEGVEIYKAKAGYSGIYSQLRQTGVELTKLYRVQDKMASSLAAGVISQTEFATLQEEVRKKIVEQQTIAEALFATLSRGGMALKTPLEVFGEFRKLLQKTTTDTALWGRFLSEAAKGSGGNIMNLVINSEGRMKELFQRITEGSTDFTQKVKSNLEMSSEHWKDYATSAWATLRDTLWAVAGEPLARSVYRGTYDALDMMGKAIDDRQGAVQSHLRQINKAFAYVGQRDIEPTLRGLGELILEAFSPTPDSKKIGQLQESLQIALQQVISDIGTITSPIFKTLAQGMGTLFETAFTSMNVDTIVNYLGTALARGLFSGFQGFLQGIGGPAGEWLRKQFTGVAKDTVRDIKSEVSRAFGTYMTTELHWGALREAAATTVLGGQTPAQYKDLVQYMLSRQAAPGWNPLEVVPLEQFKKEMEADARRRAMWTQNFTSVMQKVEAAGVQTAPPFPEPVKEVPQQIADRTQTIRDKINELIYQMQEEWSYTGQVIDKLVGVVGRSRDVHISQFTDIERVMRQWEEELVKQETQAVKKGAPSLNKY